jgi:hypothetical protein
LSKANSSPYYLACDASLSPGDALSLQKVIFSAMLSNPLSNHRRLHRLRRRRRLPVRTDHNTVIIASISIIIPEELLLLFHAAHFDGLVQILLQLAVPPLKLWEGVCPPARLALLITPDVDPLILEVPAGESEDSLGHRQSVGVVL